MIVLKVLVLNSFLGIGRDGLALQKYNKYKSKDGSYA